MLISVRYTFRPSDKGSFWPYIALPLGWEHVKTQQVKEMSNTYVDTFEGSERLGEAAKIILELIFKEQVAGGVLTAYEFV